MKRIFTERRIIILLFVIAVVVFSFASQDARDLGMNRPSVAGSSTSIHQSVTVNAGQNVAAARD